MLPLVVPKLDVKGALLQPLQLEAKLRAELLQIGAFPILEDVPATLGSRPQKASQGRSRTEPRNQEGARDVPMPTEKDKVALVVKGHGLAATAIGDAQWCAEQRSVACWERAVRLSVHVRKLGLLREKRRQLPPDGVAEPCRKVVEDDLRRVARAPSVVLGGGGGWVGGWGCGGVGAGGWVGGGGDSWLGRSMGPCGHCVGTNVHRATFPPHGRNRKAARQLAYRDLVGGADAGQLVVRRRPVREVHDRQALCDWRDQQQRGGTSTRA